MSSPIERMIDKVEFRCTICEAKAGECDCWEEAIIFEGKPLYHRPGLPGLTLCMEYPWSGLFGAIRRIHAPLESEDHLCGNCFAKDDDA